MKRLKDDQQRANVQESLSDQINSLMEKLAKDKQKAKSQEKKNVKRDQEKQSQGEEAPVNVMQELFDLVDSIETGRLTTALNPTTNAAIDFEHLINEGTKSSDADEMNGYLDNFEAT